MKDNNPHILTVSKNKQEDRLHPETFCMDRLMYELDKYVKNELQKSGKSNIGVDVAKFSDYENCMVHTDRTRLRQIFCNLIDIAVQNTETGYILFGYHTSVSNNMNFYVDDTGSGIYNENDVRYSIARGLIQQMGGKMKVFPSNNAGTSVQFNIKCYPFDVPDN